jgi:hypothetical protein
MKNFLITEEEKSRILNMHKNAIAKQYLSEQATPAPAAATPTTTTQTTQSKTEYNDVAIKGIMEQVAGLLNAEIDKKVVENPKFPNTKITVIRKVETNPDDVIYRFMYGNTQVGEGNRVSYMLVSNGAETVGNRIKGAFNISYNKTLSKTLQQLGNQVLVNTVTKMVNDWAQTYKQTTPSSPGGR